MKRKSLSVLMVVGLSLVLSAGLANTAEPLMMKDLENMSSTVSDRSGPDQTEWYLSVYDATGNEDRLGMLNFGQNTEYYYDGIIWAVVRDVALSLEMNTRPWTTHIGETVNLTYDGGKTSVIYLPAWDSETQGDNLMLYVASDGSTYYDEALTQLAQAAGTIPGGESKAIGRASQGVLDDMIINTVNYLIDNNYQPTENVTWSKVGNLYEIRLRSPMKGAFYIPFKVILEESGKTFLRPGWSHWQEDTYTQEGVYTNREILWRSVIKKVEHQGKKGKSGK